AVSRPAANGMATTALILGLTSLCVGLLTGIPAIVCGVLGLSRAKRTGTGQGRATAGLVLGGVGTVAVPIVLATWMLPAVHTIWGPVPMQDVNNFSQVGLAVINHNVTTRRLPPAYALGPDGEPNRGLSWRVTMLPYLDQEPLYRQFKLDEAWDSPANQ